MIFKTLFLALVIAVTFALPYEDQMTLANSLIVGRDDDLSLWNCKVCDNTNKPLHAHYIEEKAVDIKCIISAYEKFIVLAFRYTNTALNVWQDILYPLQTVDEHTCYNCKVQKTYNNMWGSIRNNVMNDLRDIKTQTKLDLLYITGISLGGGLAVISYIDINQANIFSKVKVTTYGAPRVGNKYWAAHFDQITNFTTRRYIVNGDPVVNMPRCLTLLCTYRQTGIKIVCYENQLQCVQETQIPDDISRRVKSALRIEEENYEGINDHIDGYPLIYHYNLKINKSQTTQ